MKVLQSLFGANGVDPVLQALAAARVVVAAGPWQQIARRGIGGLTAIGFDRKSEDMLVTSRTGQSVISGLGGDIVYRNRDDDGLDIATLKGTRMDHPADDRFDMAGVYGGGLRTVTNDGWSVEQMHGYAVLRPPPASIEVHQLERKMPDKNTTVHVLARPDETVIVIGFSWSGRTLVCATRGALTIWARPAPLAL